MKQISAALMFLTKLPRLSDNLMRLWDIRPIWIFYRAHCEHVRHKQKLLRTRILLLAYVIFISTCRALSDIKLTMNITSEYQYIREIN